MTPRERANPDLLTVDKTAASRMRRIARGSGRSLEQVESLMRDFVNMRNVMAQMSRRMMGGGSGAGPVPSNASQNPGDLATNLASGDLASNIGNRAARRKLNKKKSDASSSKKSGFGFKQ